MGEDRIPPESSRESTGSQIGARARRATGAHTSGGGEEGGVEGEARPAAARVVVVVEAGEGAGEGAPGAGRGGSGGAPGEGGREAPARDPEHGGWTVGWPRARARSLLRRVRPPGIGCSCLVGGDRFGAKSGEETRVLLLLGGKGRKPESRKEAGARKPSSFWALGCVGRKRVT